MYCMPLATRHSNKDETLECCFAFKFRANSFELENRQSVPVTLDFTARPSNVQYGICRDHRVTLCKDRDAGWDAVSQKSEPETSPRVQRGKGFFRPSSAG